MNDLPDKDQQQMLLVIEYVEKQGIARAVKARYVAKITGKSNKNLFELRSKVGSNIQRALYFHVSHGQYVITHGFTKKTQKTPKKEIAHAKELHAEWEDTQNDN